MFAFVRLTHSTSNLIFGMFAEVRRGAYYTTIFTCRMFALISSTFRTLMFLSPVFAEFRGITHFACVLILFVYTLELR